MHHQGSQAEHRCSQEYVYQSFAAAGKRIEREMEDPDNEITIADCNEIHYIYSELKSNDDFN